MSEPGETPPAGGLREALARLGEGLVAALRTRGELAGVEFAEERERLLRRLALTVGGLVLLAFAALFAGAFVIVLFWDTHRLQAIAAVAIVHAVGGALLVARARSLGKAAPVPFAATLAELERDRQRLVRVAGEAKPNP